MDVAHRATFSGHRAGGKSGCAPWVPESRQATLAHSGTSGRSRSGSIGEASDPGGPFTRAARPQAEAPARY